VLGVNWERTIETAIHWSDVVVVCLSMRALRRGGYVRRAIALAPRAANERPPDGLAIIPINLEECRPVPRLRRWQWISPSTPRGRKQLLDTLRAGQGDRSTGDHTGVAE
jgi:hypothetical protein